MIMTTKLMIITAMTKQLCGMDASWMVGQVGRAIETNRRSAYGGLEKAESKREGKRKEGRNIMLLCIFMYNCNTISVNYAIK